MPAPGAVVSNAGRFWSRGFRRFGFLPDYECDLADCEPSAISSDAKAVDSLRDARAGGRVGFCAAQSAHARIAANIAHARLGARSGGPPYRESSKKTLKLKEAKREMKQLKQEKQALRKSPERKVGQVLLAPYRLPQKLLREVRKQLSQVGNSKARVESATANINNGSNRIGERSGTAGLARRKRQNFAYQPCISIVTPVFNTPVAWLKECVESVLAQVYEKWELILVDDDSTDPEMLASVCANWRRATRGSSWTKDTRRGGISAASNHGLALAQGEWIGFLDHDDVLEPDALFQM